MSKQDMSARTHGEADTVVLDAPGKSVYESLCEKINLTPVKATRPVESFQSAEALSDSSLDERVAQAMNVFLKMIQDSSHQVDRLDKSLLDFHIAHLDEQISRQLDAIMHHETFQEIESAWRGLKFLVDRTDFRKNVKIEVLDVSKEALRQDFEDTPEVIQSALPAYLHPGVRHAGRRADRLDHLELRVRPQPQDIALLRNISKVSAAAHMPFIGSVSPQFFGKESMEEVAGIRDIGNYFDRAEYLKWKSFRASDDARYIGLTLPRFLARLPYGPETVPVRAFNYTEAVKVPITTDTCGAMRLSRLRQTWCRALSRMAGACRSAARRPAAWSRICRSTCMTWARATRQRFRPRC